MDQDQDIEKSGRGAFVGMLMALFFGGSFALFLILITGGFFLYVILAVIAICLIGFLHYLVWGEALTEDVAAEQAAKNARPIPKSEHGIQEHPRGLRRL